MSRLLFLAVAVYAAGAAARAQDAPAPPAPVPAAAEPSLPFADWLDGFMTEARGRGFGDALLAQTVAGLEPLPQVIQSDRSQPELAPDFDRYARARVSPAMILAGKDAARIHRTVLARIERDYAVQKRFVLGVWGLESRFGRTQGRTPVFQALATLAWEGRRGAFFRGELFNALTMVDRGYIDAATMTGSWAGAMGQTQFIPSSYLTHAVDFDGDGRRDIWASAPDALASIANYLKAYGWNAKETWGREVRVSAAAQAKIASRIPKRTGGCSAQRSMTERRPLDEWRSLGVRRSDGGPLPRASLAAGLVDVGSRTFLVYPNYDALLAYNCAHFYALSVGMLGDRLK